jgi:uncharacterized protein
MNTSTTLPSTIAELVQLLKLIPHPEGGYFREIHRSGSVPMASRGLTDSSIASHANRSLVRVLKQDLGEDRGKMDDDFVERNALTSIFWVPTRQSPKLLLAVNLSDHVHYYQGGGFAFIYYIYDPKTSTFRSVILGPNLSLGQELQVAVASGEWKCGHLAPLDATLERDHGTFSGDVSVPLVDVHPDYAIIGEAVGPGFDVHDFRWISESDMNDLSREVRSLLLGFLHPDTNVIVNKNRDFDQHYDSTLHVAE